MALALARRYRPKRFSDLLVQNHVAAVLRGAIVNHRVGHGYLLTGPRGVGKTSVARILAMALNCERKGTSEPPGEPCGECQTCQRIWNGSANLDVVEIDAASNRSVDDARELRERAMYAASTEDHYKVYIVDEAHMLTREAWNALLKILEEPPPRVVFVFATTEPQKIAQQAAPVLSRLQRFDFRRIGQAAIRARLKEVLAAEGVGAEDDAVILIARHADGGMRDALSVLDQCLSFGEGIVTVERVREVLGLIADELYGDLLDLVVERRPADVFPLVDRVVDAGADLAEFVGGAADMLRALLILQVGGEPEGIGELMRRRLLAVRDRLSQGDTLRMLKLIADNEAGIRRGGNARLLIETLLLRFAMLDRIVDLEQVLGRGQPPRSNSRSEPAQAPPEPVPAVPEGGVPFTLDGLLAAWPALVVLARERSRFLGEALAVAKPEQVAPPAVTISLPAGDALHGEALDRQREALETLFSRQVGAPVRVRVANTPGAGAKTGGTRRLTEAQAKAERLEAVRAKDPSLETAAAELDLEIVE